MHAALPPPLMGSGRKKCMRSRRGGARSVAPPFPARHARPSLRLGWAAAPAPAPRGVPPALAPRLRVVAAPSPRKGFPLRAVPALALAPLLPPRLAPPLAPRGAPGRCGASSRPSALGSRSLRAGAPVPPCPAPYGGSCAPAPPGGLPGAAAPRLFVRSCAPPGFGVVLPPLRRRRCCAVLFRFGRVLGVFPARLRRCCL